MKIFYSNMGSVKGIEKYLDFKIDFLTSFYGLKKLEPPIWSKDIFLDSGAFSAFKQKVKIDINSYIEFIKNNTHKFFVYSNLDVIGDSELTWENQLIMEASQLSPIPVFHYKEDWKWLKLYATKYDYIALGGLVPISGNKFQINTFLNNCFCILNEIQPDIKVHGFGVQSEELLKKFPWYSVDASSVHVIARYGGIYSPWGSFKINPKVNAKEVSYIHRSPLIFKKLTKWFDSLKFSFPFNELQEQTSEGTLKRCCASIKYFENLKKDINNSFFSQKTKNSFGII